MNLLTNAVKYTDRDGSIMVLIELVSDSEIRVSVSDTGRGIKEKD
jgi:signal transduction histidine kinase